MKKYSLSSLIALIFLASCSSNNDLQLTNKEVAQKKDVDALQLSKLQFESSDIQLETIEKRAFNKVVKATGMIDVPPESRATVSTFFGGTVKEIKLLPGQKVKKGQSLFTLQNPEFVQIQQDYLEAKGQLKYLKSDFERQKNLASDNISSQKTFLKAESEYTMTQVQVASLRKKLELMKINPNTLSIDNIQTTINITSPIDGYITQVDIAKGTFLSPSKTAITIVNTDHLHLELNIFEKDLPKVKIGQEISFNIQEDNRTNYKAIVYLVNKNVDPIKRSIGIHGHLSDELSTESFSQGMYIEAEIYSNSALKASLPQSALAEVEGKYYALILKAETDKAYEFLKKEIKIGDFYNGYVSILNQQDFKAGTQFMTNGAFNLIVE